MKIAFDHDKSDTNVEKHGVWLNAAELLDWSSVMAYVDTRRDYGEGEGGGFRRN